MSRSITDGDLFFTKTKENHFPQSSQYNEPENYSTD